MRTAPVQQLMIRPTEMLPFMDLADDREHVVLNNRNGYPALEFDERGIVTFTALYPHVAQQFKARPLHLRLYCTAFPLRQVKGTRIPVEWWISWRWVRALGPIASEAPFNEPAGWRRQDLDTADDGTLLPSVNRPPDVPATNSQGERLPRIGTDAGQTGGFFQMNLIIDDPGPTETRPPVDDPPRQRLSISDPILILPQTAPADYLMVYLEVINTRGLRVDLLMAELRG
jgi:hypothetical protein